MSQKSLTEQKHDPEKETIFNSSTCLSPKLTEETSHGCDCNCNPNKNEKWCYGDGRLCQGIISSNGSVVTITVPNGTIYGTNTVRKGVHEWKIKCNFAKVGCQWVGVAATLLPVATNTTNTANTATSRNNFTNDGYKQHIIWCNQCQCVQNVPFSSIGDKINKQKIHPSMDWESGDEISVRLDLNDKMVLFYHNIDENPNCVASFPININNIMKNCGSGGGSGSGGASGNINSIGYKIAVCGNVDDSFEILPPTWLKTALLPIRSNFLPNIDVYSNKLSEIENEITKYKIGDTGRLMECEKIVKEFKSDSALLLEKIKSYLDGVAKIEGLISQQLTVDISNYKNWNVNQIVRYICDLENGKFKKYSELLTNSFMEQEIRGSDLPSLDKNDLLLIGIKNFADRKELMEAFQLLDEKHEEGA